MALINNCYDCIHKRSVPGNTHIGCTNPDMNVQGDLRATVKGWFFYPILFDPVWMTTKCSNFTSEPRHPMDRQQQRAELEDSETHRENWISFCGDEDAVDLDGTFTKAQLIEIANLVGPSPG